MNCNFCLDTVKIYSSLDTLLNCNSCLDTPCTTALHIGERAPDVAGAIFKDRNGCFEKPSLDKEPSFQSLPKLQVKLVELKTGNKALSVSFLVWDSADWFQPPSSHGRAWKVWTSQDWWLWQVLCWWPVSQCPGIRFRLIN